MARVTRTITLKHQANLGVDVEDVELREGTELTLLEEWEHHCLVKDAEGRLFNAPKDAVAP